MEVFYFKEDIAIETMGDMVQLLNTSEEEELVLYFTSSGGHVPAAQVLMNFLENKFKKIYIICAGYVVSAAWKLIMMIDNAEIVVLDGCYGHDHLSTMIVDTEVRVGITKTEQLGVYKECTREIDEPWIEYCENILKYSKSELRKLKAGEEVFFIPKRFRELVNNKETHFKNLNDGTV